jgi:hypothetical protein
MRQVDQPLKPAETAEPVELELSFEFDSQERLHAAIEDLFGEKLADEQPPSPGAGLRDCQELLASSNGLLWFATSGIEASEDFLSPYAAAGSDDYFVKRLHYGSPFDLEFLLPFLTPAGLACLFYACKRLFGIDLEFKAYREKRRLEYLEAKRMAEEMTEGDIPTADIVKPPRRWKLRRGILRDRSS